MNNKNIIRTARFHHIGGYAVRGVYPEGTEGLTKIGVYPHCIHTTKIRGTYAMLLCAIYMKLAIDECTVALGHRMGGE